MIRDESSFVKNLSRLQPVIVIIIIIITSGVVFLGDLITGVVLRI